MRTDGDEHNGTLWIDPSLKVARGVASGAVVARRLVCVTTDVTDRKYWG